MPEKDPIIKNIVIVGPTSSGKSDLAVQIARKVTGEVISADSRQVYRGMDLGTGKITKKEMRGVPHHMLDIANPIRNYDVSKYKKTTEKIIKDITKREHVPLLCGGTGYYVQAIVDNITPPEAPPNKELRTELGVYSVDRLYSMLKRKDPRRASEIDRYNKRRIVRALEIIDHLGIVPAMIPVPRKNWSFLQIGLAVPPNVLHERIHKRILIRLKHGMIAEIEHLHEQGLSWKRMEELGLEYRFISLHVRGKLSKQQMIDDLYTATCQYAKRQLTWFRKDKRIIWLDFQESKKALHLSQDYLQKPLR